jgi:hypothetical protein
MRARYPIERPSVSSERRDRSREVTLQTNNQLCGQNPRSASAPIPVELATARPPTVRTFALPHRPRGEQIRRQDQKSRLFSSFPVVILALTPL